MRYNAFRKQLHTKERTFYGIEPKLALQIFENSSDKTFTLVVVKQTTEKQKRQAIKSSRRMEAVYKKQLQTSPYGQRNTNFTRTLGA